MKNIFVAAVFLFSQLGFSAEKAKQVQHKKFEIEDLTFSQLILTKEEIIHLSPEDQVKYVFSMIALTQIIEGSQKFQMGYTDSTLKKTSSYFFKNKFQEFSSLFQIFLSQAHAQALEAVEIAATVSVPLLERLGLSAMLNTAKGWFTRAAVAAAKEGAKDTAKVSTSREIVAVGEAKVQKNTVAEGFRVATVPGQVAVRVVDAKAKEIASKTVLETAKKLKDAEVAMTKKIGKKGYEAADAEIKAYNKLKDGAMKADERSFINAGGTEDELTKLLNESKIKKFFMLIPRNAWSLTKTAGLTYAADTAFKQATGTSITDMVIDGGISTGRFVKSLFHQGTDLSGPGAILTPAQLAAGDSKQESGKVCLFGGIPSQWKEFSEGLKCTRPTAAANANCKMEDGLFQCPAYGFQLAEGDINKHLCIKSNYDTQTVSCVGALTDILKEKKSTLTSDDAVEALKKSFGDTAKALEARDQMKNEKGETKSIFEYCAADSVNEFQKDECGAIKEAIALLKTTDFTKIQEGRKVAAAAAPAEGAPGTGAPAKDAAQDAGVTH